MPGSNGRNIIPDLNPIQTEPVPRLALRPREAAIALGISERALWKLTAEGVIPVVKIGRSKLYPVAGLRQWLAERAEAAPAGGDGGESHSTA